MSWLGRYLRFILSIRHDIQINDAFVLTVYTNLFISKIRNMYKDLCINDNTTFNNYVLQLFSIFLAHMIFHWAQVSEYKSLML